MADHSRFRRLPFRSKRADDFVAVFEATIEYREGKLRGNIESRELEAIVESTLRQDLPEKLADLFGIEASVSIKDKRYHSLSVFFAVAVSAYGIISGYKDLFESIELIRQQASDLLESAVTRAGNYQVNVYGRFPISQRTLERHWDYPWDFPSHRHRSGLYAPPMSPEPPRRDAFFWLLLIVCLIQFVLIGFLVYGAVQKTYFPG